jgi:orotidine-5'-phosphate decarboxylase
MLIERIRKSGSFLCVGLDPDAEKMPDHLFSESDPVYEFNKSIVDATAGYCVAYKLNNAFYEAAGLTGLESLEKTIRYIKSNYPEHFVIADAKRGDIGNTSAMYASAIFRRLGADAVTVSPYMGRDSVMPFLEFSDRWTIVLGLTSNPGAADFQEIDCGGKPFFLRVIETCAGWGSERNMMFVAGATRASNIAAIRKLVPNHFLLVPGIGAQGGNLHEVCANGMTPDCGLLVNVSRNILYASRGTDFAEQAGKAAEELAAEMSHLLEKT